LDAVKLYRNHTIAELTAMQERICADPKNRMPEGSLYLYRPQARRKLDAIRWAITYHLRDRKSKGETTQPC